MNEQFPTPDANIKKHYSPDNREHEGKTFGTKMSAMELATLSGSIVKEFPNCEHLHVVYSDSPDPAHWERVTGSENFVLIQDFSPRGPEQKIKTFEDIQEDDIESVSFDNEHPTT
jgi:hypothetical protein